MFMLCELRLENDPHAFGSKDIANFIPSFPDTFQFASSPPE